MKDECGRMNDPFILHPANFILPPPLLLVEILP
jgi:hypothetical protein